MFWLLFGCLADYSFPFGQAIELILACFKGTVASKVNTLQQQLQNTEVVPNVGNTQQVRRLSTLKQQVKKLNNLDSQAWLYEGVLGRIGSNPSVNHEKIAKTLEALEYKRNEILKELEPRRPQKYRILSKFQNSVQGILDSQDEKDYRQLQKIVTNLILFTKSKKPSQIILSEIITKLSSEISRNNKKISPSRLRIAYRIDELMRVVSEKLILDSNSSRTDGNYQLIVDELRSRINLLSQEFNNLLKTKQEDKKELNRRTQEVSNLTKNISDLHQDISNRDSDISTLGRNIQNLTKSVKEKQAQIDSLQNLIYDLQRDIRDSDAARHQEYDQVSQLQRRLSQLNEQKLTLQERIDDILANTRKIESKVEILENEKSHLSSQKSELQRQNQILQQQYLHQQDMISSLNKQLKDLDSSINSVATQSQISEEEYQRISNKSEYGYVKSHAKKNGTWVEAYYRRNPSSRRKRKQ